MRDLPMVLRYLVLTLTVALICLSISYGTARKWRAALPDISRFYLALSLLVASSFIWVPLLVLALGLSPVLGISMAAMTGLSATLVGAYIEMRQYMRRPPEPHHGITRTI